MNKSNLYLLLFFGFFVSTAPSLYGELIILGGNIVNQQGASGNLNYDTDNDGVTDLVMTTEGRFGIGTLNPSTNLHVVGNLIMVDGNEQNNRVLASDSNGLARWADLDTLGGAWTSSNGNIYVNSGNVAVGTTSPADVGIHVLRTTEQLRLGYNTANYASFTVDSFGQLAIGSSLVSMTTLQLSTIRAIGGDLTLTDHATATTFDLLRFGGTSALYPALKRNSTELQFRLANDSDFASFQSGNVTFHGNVDIGAHNSYDIGMAGNAFRNIYSIDFTVVSDRRLKEDIKPIAKGLDEIMSLRPVSFKFKESQGKTHLGFIAQEAEDVVPEVVSGKEENGDTMGMQYSSLVPVLVKAVQEQQKEIKEQREMIRRQSEELNQLKKQLDK